MELIFTFIYFTAWGFALIWITISCKWGLARPINNFLSYPAFLPLSRLTYCTYLIHPITQVVTSFQMQGPTHIRHLMIFTIFLGNAVISYICAFIVSVMFEAPVVRILRVLFRKWGKLVTEYCHKFLGWMKWYDINSYILINK